MACVAVNRLVRLGGIGIAAGAFSALFGVGGGAIIVPLLIWLGYGERSATGTSLAAICVIALFAAISHALYGNVHLDKAVLIGAPAVGGELQEGPSRHKEGQEARNRQGGIEAQVGSL